MIARGLEVELDEIRETVERLPLDETVTTESMGDFEKGTQGAVRFEVQGIVAGEPLIVVEHVTRIHPSCAPHWPTPPDGAGAHRVIIEGGNATAVGRLVGAIEWLVDSAPGLYDALDVPLQPATGRLGAAKAAQEGVTA